MSSVILENMCDGVVEYEYLYLLKNLGGDVEVSQPVVTDPADYSFDPELLYQVRKEVVRRIEKSIEGN